MRKTAPLFAATRGQEENGVVVLGEGRRGVGSAFGGNCHVTYPVSMNHNDTSRQSTSAKMKEGWREGKKKNSSRRESCFLVVMGRETDWLGGWCVGGEEGKTQERDACPLVDGTGDGLRLG